MSIQEFKTTKLNILLVGATGVGKSSTINALFSKTKINELKLATIGEGVQPETKNVQDYHLGDITIWDTPGLGDTEEADFVHKQNIEHILNRKDNSVPVIDLIIVIIDATNKNLTTTINLINNILIPNLGKDAKKRIIVALNKIDMVKSGQYWNNNKNEPDDILNTYLTKMQDDIKSRIYDSTNLILRPIIYSAGNNFINQKPYNLLCFINTILKNLPNEKRKIILTSTNKKESNWQYNNDNEKERAKTKEILKEILRTGISLAISSLFGGLFFFNS